MSASSSPVPGEPDEAETEPVRLGEANPVEAASAVSPQRVAIERHRRGNRWMHWINFPLLTIMIWSGLRIYWADLRDPFGVGIAGWHWFELFPDWVNERLGLNRKLARGMAFHFTFGWLFVLNGIAFGLYIWRTGGWRNFIPTRYDLRSIPGVLLHDLGLRDDEPARGKYNGVQQLVYGAVLVMGALAVLSGFAIYKPTQLAPLTTLFGGYESARTVHFAITMAFIVFFVVHLVQVARAGFATFWSMITGYEVVSATSAEVPRDTASPTEPHAPDGEAAAAPSVDTGAEEVSA